MVYGAALEMRFGSNPIEGSNPSLSATLYPLYGSPRLLGSLAAACLPALLNLKGAARYASERRSATAERGRRLTWLRTLIETEESWHAS